MFTGHPAHSCRPVIDMQHGRGAISQENPHNSPAVFERSSQDCNPESAPEKTAPKNQSYKAATNGTLVQSGHHTRSRIRVATRKAGILNITEDAPARSNADHHAVTKRSTLAMEAFSSRKNAHRIRLLIAPEGIIAPEGNQRRNAGCLQWFTLSFALGQLPASSGS